MNEFDFRTHIVDPKSGKTLKHQPYRMAIHKDHGITLYRDGVAYHPDGSPKEKPMAPSIVEPEAPQADSPGVKRNART